MAVKRNKMHKLLDLTQNIKQFSVDRYSSTVINFGAIMSDKMPITTWTVTLTPLAFLLKAKQLH